MNVRAAATFGLALAVAHGLTCLPTFLDGLQLSAFLRMAPDAAVVLGIAMLGVASGWRRSMTHLAALLLVLSLLFGAAAALWPMFRDRQFEWSNVGEIAGLPHLLFDLPPDWWVATLVLGPVLLLLHLLSYFSLRRLAAAGGNRGMIAWITILQGLVVVAVFASGGIWHGSSLGAMARETARTAFDWLGTESDPTKVAPPAGAELLAAAPADLRGLDGADVHVIFIESYGRVALRHPVIGSHLRALWPDLLDELAAAGFSTISGACRPAVSGGGSILAHTEFFTGVRVPDHRTRERLQNCDLRPLPRLFVDAGYHTVEVMPAMDRHWPEGAEFFGFTEQVTQLELGYEGFRYPFGKMPDQFALHHLLKRVVEPAQQPIFSAFVSVTSHLPCTYIPPYVADWDINAASFSVAPALEYDLSWFNARTSPDTVPAFRDAIEYSVRTAVGFACRLPRPSIVIVLGDHQPPIKTVLVPGETSNDVPLHVLSNRPELLEALAPLGLVAGLDVPDALPAFDSADFAPLFVTAFSRP